MTAAATVFDLPARLAAKAAPALIEEDERHFRALQASLDHSISELTRRLETARRAPATPGSEAVERDFEVRRLATRLRILSRYGVDLCLGRIVPDDAPEPIYIGRLGLTDSTGSRLLVDWRSPAAEPFFAATHATPMGVRSRRRYRWTGRHISDYWDEVFSEELLTEQQSRAALDDQSAFIASLASTRSRRMRDVLGTIQADQDAIIRAGSRGALVVDGGPGTGKTVVALHRTAYLLYSDPRLTPRRGSSGGSVLFVGPSAPYLAYVDDVLPSLGEDSVQSCTLRGLVAEGPDAVAEPDARVSQLKSTLEMAAAIEAAARHYERPPTTGMAVETEWADVWLDADDWTDAFGSAEPGLSHNDARDQVWEALLAIVVDRHDDEDVPVELVLSSLQRNRELRAAFARAWPVLDPAGVVADLWSVPAFLGSCAPWLSDADILLLQRKDPRAWTVADLPLLDAARHRIGDPEASRTRHRQERAIAVERQRIQRVVDDLLAAEDDFEGEVQLLRQERARDALLDPDALPHLDPDSLAGPFAHLAVDEAQELTDAEWLMLLRRCPSRSFTIVGDRAQARREFSESWEARLERLGIRHVTLASLTVNYRTPQEVMDAAEPVIRSVRPDANVPTSIRRSGMPVRRGVATELHSVLSAWQDEHVEGVACVIGAGSGAPSRMPGLDRVSWLTPELSKGIEFDLVVLVEAPEFADDLASTVDRYVAMTRATQQLVILRGDPSSPAAALADR